MAQLNNISKVAGAVAMDTEKLVLSQPKKADMHSYGNATLQDNIEYRERLDNISHTAATADNVMNVVTDPKKIIGLILLVGLIVLIVYLLKSQLKSVFSGIGSWWKNRQDIKDSDNQANNRYGDANGYSPGFEDMAQDLADRIYNAISWTGDNEEAIYSALREVKTTSDWILLKKKFDNDNHWWSKGVLALKKYGDLVTCLTDNLDDTELAKCRNILITNGVDHSAIGF